MLTSILAPVVDGAQQRGSRWIWLLAALHTLGNMVSAAAVGAVLSLAAVALRARGHDSTVWGSWLAALIALLYLPRQLGWTRLPRLLQSHCQVPREWAYDYPRWVTALLFGLGLGSGLYTRILVPTFYLVLLWPFVSPGFTFGLLLWIAYVLARSLNVWLLALTTPSGDPFPYAARFLKALARSATMMNRAHAMLLGVAAVWLLVAVGHV